MSQSQKIKTALERNIKALTLRPGIGQGTAITKVRVTNGLTCEIEEGPWTLTADMSEKHGGNDTGPNPGMLGRAALGSCLAMCYMRWAAKLDVAIDRLFVEIQADYDARGEYGVADVSIGYKEVRYIVTVECDAPEDDIMRVLDLADALSSYVDVFTSDQNLRREVRILQTVQNA